MPNKTIKIPRKLTRAAAVTREGDSMVVSISSDKPYKRYDYVWGEDGYKREEYFEILDHSPGGLDSERLDEGLPFLFNHNRDANLANAKSYTNDGHKVTLDVSKFAWASGEFAENKRKDMESGALPHTSVGYEITGDGVCVGAKDGCPLYKFPWKIFEGSLVTIAADVSVGVNKAHEISADDDLIELQIKSLDDSTNPSQNQPVANSPQMKLSPFASKHFRDKDTGGGSNGGEGTVTVDVKAERAEALKDFKARCKKIDEWLDPEKNPAMKNDRWRAACVKVAAKHKDADADFGDFREEALGHCVTVEVIDEPQRGFMERQLQRIIDGRDHGGKIALSIGAQFVRSKEFQERGAETGRRRSIVIDTDMSALGIRGKVAMAQRAGFNSSDLTAINVAPMQQLVALGVERLTVMDLIAPGTTAHAAIPYPVETTLGTLEGVALTGGKPYAGTTGERGIKPTWEPDVTTDTANVKKIAVISKVPDEFLADFPGFQSYIDMRMPFMVDLKAEQQILYGDGIGNNIKGITTFAGIQTRAYATTWADTIRKAITDVEVGSFFTVDGIVMHPYDWEVASLEKDVNGQYLAGGPYYIPYGNGVFMEMRTFWGKPVVASTVVTVGQPLVGCWKLGAQYFLREGMRIETTNSNEDDFKRNLIALRAEERLALAVYRPPCFLEVTGGPART